MTVQPLVSSADASDDDNVVLVPDLQLAPCENYGAVYRLGLQRDLKL